MKKRAKKWFLILLCIAIQINSVQNVLAEEIIDSFTPNTIISSDISAIGGEKYAEGITSYDDSNAKICTHNYTSWRDGSRTCISCGYVQTCTHPSGKNRGFNCDGLYHYNYKLCSTCSLKYVSSTTYCDCHDCSYTTKVYGSHTSTGHDVYMKCSCGSQIPKGTKEANSSCISCTTAPTVTIKNLSANTTLGTADTAFKLQIDISDNENDTLTCKYYINDSATPVGTETVTGTNPTKTVTFAASFNATTLPQGQNKIRVEVKDSIAPVGTATTTFYVDTQAPVINGYTSTTTYNSANITVTASDASSPIEYRYTVGSNVTGWLSSQATYNFSNLIPNTTYTYKVEARDIKGNISSCINTFTTKPQVPSINLKQNINSIKIDISDTNPTDTLYKVKINNKYLSNNGILTDVAVWIEISSKTITAINLSGNTEYTVTVYAKDRRNAIEVASQQSIIKTTNLAPSGLACTGKTSDSISLKWDTFGGALSYDVKRVGKVIIPIEPPVEPEPGTDVMSIDITGLNEQELDNSQNIYTYTNISATSFSEYNLYSNTEYIYYIRAKLSEASYGDWSGALVVSTLPSRPGIVLGLNVTLEPLNIKLSWTKQAKAVGYEVLINGQSSLYTQASSISIPSIKPNEQYILRVRSFNECDTNDPADSTKWSNEGIWSRSVIIYTPSNAPKDIVINNITYESIQFAWNKNNNPESVLYKCELYKDDILIKESGEINANIYSFSGLESQSQYTLKVWAINSNNIKSISSAEYVFNTKIIPPDAPGQLRASAKDKKITLSWESAARAFTYTIKRDGIIIADYITDNKYFDTELLPDTIYTYEVIACNESGTSSTSIVQKTKGEAPDIPAIISHNSSSTSMQITWDEVIGATGYDIKCDGKIFNTELNTTFEHKGLSSGSEHTYSIRARNIYDNSEWSFPQTFKTIPTAPIIPDGIILTATHSQVNISWNPVVGADSYTLNVDGIEIIGITIPEYTYTFDSTVTSESEHIIKIMAVNEGGNSGYTAPLSITLLPVINAPMLTGIVEGSAIKLSWSTIENASGYEIETDYATTTSASAITTSYIDTVSSLNQPHTYRVRAIFDGSVGEWSYAVTIKAIPSIPTQLTGSSGQNSVNVQWNKCDWAIEYELLADGEIIYSGPNTTFTHSSLLDNSTHIYSARAGNQSGYSDWSTPITVTTQKEITNVPQNIIPSRESQNSVIITWDSVKEAKGYMVKINSDQPQSVDVPMISISTTPQAIYAVSVAAILDSEQNILGEWSSETTFQGPIAIPETPIFGNITSTEYSVQLNWNNATNASGYDLEINNDNIVKIYTNTYYDSNIPAKTTRNYRIRSFNESGVSNWSESISATTNGALPGAPINLICKNGVATTGAAISIDWDDTTNAISYEVKDSSGNIYTTTNSTIIIDGLQNGTPYQFQVRAITVEGQGPWSSSVSYVTDIIALVNIVASNTETDSILLTWNASSGATKYEIEMDGIIVGDTEGTSLVIDQASRYLTHSFRLRALNAIKASEWTEPLIYNQNIPLQVSVVEGEEFSILMPVSNVKNISQYKMTIIINTEDIGLIDACEFTPKHETTTTYFESNNMQIIVDNVNNLCYISMIINNDSIGQMKEIINSISLYGKKNCITEINYNVSIFR